MEKENIIKEFITYKRAKIIAKKINKILSSLGREIIFKEEIDSTIGGKQLIISIEKYWFKPDEFADLIKLLMAECVKYKLSFYGYCDKKLEIEINVER